MQTHRKQLVAPQNRDIASCTSLHPSHHDTLRSMEPAAGASASSADYSSRWEDEFWGKPGGLKPGEAFDAQAPSPALTHLLTTGAVELAGRRMLVPGCGRGYDLIAFLRSGVAEAVGLELSTSAQQQAEAYLQQQLTAEEKAHAKVVAGDFFKWQGEAPFEAGYDYTFFCALHPTMRQDWAAAWARHLKPDALLVCLAFPLNHTQEGPPWPVTVDDYKQLLLPQGFELVSEEPVPPERSHQGRGGKECMLVFQRKPFVPARKPHKTRRCSELPARAAATDEKKQKRSAATDRMNAYRPPSREGASLRAEAEAPFRSLRIFLFGAGTASAVLATLFGLPNLIAALAGAPGAIKTASEALQDLAINLGGLSVCGYLVLRDLKAGEKQMARLLREDELGACQLELANRRVLRLAQLRSFARVVLIAGTPQQVSQSLANAEPYKQQLEAAGVLVVPLPFVSSSDGGDSSSSIGETPAGGLSGLDPPGPEDLRWRATAIRLDDWRRWFEQQADLAGKSLSDGLYISLRLDGRVRGSGKGSPPWAVMAAQLPPTEGFFGGFFDGMDGRLEQASALDGQGLGGQMAEAVNTTGEAAGAMPQPLVNLTAEVQATMINGRKCYLSIGRGPLAGQITGPTGAMSGGVAGALDSLDACKDAVHFAYSASEQATRLGSSSPTSSPTQVLDTARADISSIGCPSGASAVNNIQECDQICAEAYPNCPYYFRYSQQCCTCTPDCPAVSDPAAPSTPAPTASLGLCPTTSMGVDLQPVYTTGVPVGDLAEEGTVLSNTTVKWVPVTTPSECCQACTAYFGCHAWTWKAAEYCSKQEVLPTACCFFKAVSGWQIEYKQGEYLPNFVSGLAAPVSNAQCTGVQSDVDLYGGDLLPDNADQGFVDTVVAAASPQECCNFCNAYVGCTAWTLSDPSDCQDRLGAANPGCCFLKLRQRTQDILILAQSRQTSVLRFCSRRQLEQASALDGQGLGGQMAEAVNTTGEAAGAMPQPLVNLTAEVQATMINGRKCYLSIGRGPLAGQIMGPTGAMSGGVAGALDSLDACKDAVHFAYSASEQATRLGSSSPTSSPTQVLDTARADISSIGCPSGASAVNNIQECDQICAEAYPNCPYYFRYSQQCCTCTPDCPAVPDTPATCPTASTGVQLEPTITADGVPVGNIPEEGQVLDSTSSKWVPASNADECCQACASYFGCYAWTWKALGHCTMGGIVQPTECCYFKARLWFLGHETVPCRVAYSGWHVKYKSGDDAPFFVSGLAPQVSDAQCTGVQSDVDLYGGDLLPENADQGFVDTVVAAANPQECCNFCNAYVGCTAWTLSDPSDCQDRLGADNQGCCFLKTFGYTPVPKAGTVSGRLA
ncbi:Protein LOW PSII ACCUMULATION 1 [Chlorella vulgaris]